MCYGPNIQSRANNKSFECREIYRRCAETVQERPMFMVRAKNEKNELVAVGQESRKQVDVIQLHRSQIQVLKRDCYAVHVFFVTPIMDHKTICCTL